jgi:AAA domain
MANRDTEIAKIKKRIVPVSKAQPYVRVLLYGRNGQGKTRIACTAPKPLVLDMNEEGTQSVRNYPDVEVLHCKKWADVVFAYWMLREGDHPYESVVLDTLTGMQGLGIRQVLRESEDRDPTKDPKVMSMREWGKLAEIMKEQILNFRNLPMHVIYTAQQRTIDDPDTEAREIVPDLSPGSRGPSTSAVGIIGHVFQKEVRAVDRKTKKEVSRWETRLLVGPHEEYTTKDRTGALGRVVRKPTIPMMIEAAAANPESMENHNG